MDNTPKDYFKILEITKDDLTAPDSDKRVKKAYRRLARQFHPDANASLPKDDKKLGQMKELNEAYGILSDSEKREQYVKMVGELHLHYGEVGNEERLKSKQDLYEDKLGDKTYKLPNLGMGVSGFAMKDLMEALKRFNQGEDIESINSWIRERSQALKLDVYESNPGIPRILFRPYLFLENKNLEVYIHEIVNFLTKETKDRYIEPNEFVDIRHFTRPDSYGNISNVQLGKIPQDRWQDIFGAVAHLADYQTGWEINTGIQIMDINALVHAERDFGPVQMFDSVHIPKQRSGNEGNRPVLGLPQTIS